jgi:hypothetical protein
MDASPATPVVILEEKDGRGGSSGSAGVAAETVTASRMTSTATQLGGSSSRGAASKLVSVPLSGPPQPLAVGLEVEVCVREALGVGRWARGYQLTSFNEVTGQWAMRRITAPHHHHQQQQQEQEEPMQEQGAPPPPPPQQPQTLQQPESSVDTAPPSSSAAAMDEMVCVLRGTMLFLTHAVVVLRATQA